MSRIWKAEGGWSEGGGLGAWSCLVLFVLLLSILPLFFSLSLSFSLFFSLSVSVFFSPLSRSLVLHIYFINLSISISISIYIYIYVCVCVSVSLLFFVCFEVFAPLSLLLQFLPPCYNNLPPLSHFPPVQILRAEQLR